MIDEVRNNLDKIVDTCKKMQVKSLYLFGSGAREKDYNRESDLDFLFQFKVNQDGMPLAGYDYFDLLYTLEAITGKKVDLVAQEKLINKYLLERINKEKVKIYEA
jgi:predicted nucleotidyltransferase